ncbi:neprilysin-3 [Trichonephila clavipes]|nr:neprilysin-3 [Trichonephila clavipes]
MHLVPIFDTPAPASSVPEGPGKVTGVSKVRYQILVLHSEKHQEHTLHTQRILSRLARGLEGSSSFVVSWRTPISSVSRQYSSDNTVYAITHIITRFLQRGNGNRFLLPALDFSTEQILYISLAQMWCSVSSKEKEQLHHDRDVHAPSDVRITGMLRNLREFSEAFGCIPGTHMNPTERCAFRLRS